MQDVMTDAAQTVERAAVAGIACGLHIAAGLAALLDPAALDVDRLQALSDALRAASRQADLLLAELDAQEETREQPMA